MQKGQFELVAKNFPQGFNFIFGKNVKWLDLFWCKVNM